MLRSSVASGSLTAHMEALALKPPYENSAHSR